MPIETRPPVLLRFGVFEVDLRAGELRKRGKRIRLQDQPFQVLTVLLQRPGDVVTREELRSQIWPEDTFVDFDNSLNTAINKLREALGDSADNPRFIETLPRRGYRFLAPVSGKNGTPAGTGAGVSTISTLHSRKTVASVACIMLAGAIGGALFWRARHQPRLTEKDTIVLADFKNTTGDPVFDDTLKQGLRMQLEQSPFLNTLSDQKVNEELRLMGRSADERLTQNVARDLCQRAGSKAVVEGSISSLGTHYAVGLNAFDCLTGSELANEQVEADSREHVLKALGESATRMREKLGESLASVQKYNVPLAQATTASLEALKAYSLGMRTWQAKGETAAFPLFKAAVELDPKFAMAYARMGAMYGNLFQLDLSNQNVSKAYELRANTSVRERLLIESQYYDYVSGEKEKTVQTLELRTQLYPLDFLGHNNLANARSDVGRHEQSLEEALVAMRLAPDAEDNYITLCDAYVRLNRLPEAEEVLKQAAAHKLESEGLTVERYQIAFLKGNEEEMERLASVAKPGADDWLLGQKEAAEAYRGRLSKAREVAHMYMNAGKQHESSTIPALTQAGLGLLEGYFGEAKQARVDAKAAVLRAAPKDFPRWICALALTTAGDSKTAAKMVGELDKNLPLDTSFQQYWKPSIRAVIAMDNKNPKEAIDLLRVTSPYELSTMGSMDPVYLRGQAYLALGNVVAAAGEFQKVIEHPGIVRNWPIGALAHLGLARAYSQQGDTTKARVAYQDFLALWKDADPDIPILLQAKAEYAKLE